MPTLDLAVRRDRFRNLLNFGPFFDRAMIGSWVWPRSGIKSGIKSGIESGGESRISDDLLRFF